MTVFNSSATWAAMFRLQDCFISDFFLSFTIRGQFAVTFLPSLQILSDYDSQVLESAQSAGWIAWDQEHAGLSPKATRPPGR